MTALTRLRIAGFKSFAEPVSIDILPGLTGIVGPNGCGKSNVVEALRWAMGETSARSLRGGEMDDVIFAGTTARPSRNLAEVTITLEGPPLPDPFAAEAELQVTRRIERGAGSSFRANGQEMRARDVQTLYADLASGARSSGMVSQGRVAELVNARPEERRRVLEEAAGITGLHARRHEAELKLRAAEQNLARAEDLRGQLEITREGLRKQARQAARYRNISGLIRVAEAEHLAVLHAQADTALNAARDAHTQTQRLATDAAAESRICGEALAEAESALPAPREAENLARSLLERRRVEAESLGAEAARVAAEAEAAKERLLELETDLAAAERARVDAASSVDRLRSELAALTARQASLPADLAAADHARTAAIAQDEAARDAADRAAAAATDAASLQREAASALQSARERTASLRTRHETAMAEHTAHIELLIPPARLAACAEASAAAEAFLVQARIAVAEAESRRDEAVALHQAARAKADQDAMRQRAAVQARDDAALREADLARLCASAERALAEAVAGLVPEATLTNAENAATAARSAQADFEQALEAAEQAASGAGAAHDAAVRRAADNTAARARAAQALREAERQAAAIATQAGDAAEALRDARRQAPQAGARDRVNAACQEAEHHFVAQETGFHTLCETHAAAERRLTQIRDAANSATADLARLTAEVNGLQAAIGGGDGTSLMDTIDVPDGLELALAAALGDGWEASLDEASLRFWRDLPPETLATRPQVPDGSVALGALVHAPRALARVLAHVALLPDDTPGDTLQATLAPGMAAVNRQGDCWRWDGHVVRAGAPLAAATRLRQRNQLRTAEAARNGAESAALVCRTECDDAAHIAAAAAAAERATRAVLSEAEAELRRTRQQADALTAQAAQADARYAALQPIAERLATDKELAAQTLAAAQGHLASLEPPATLDAERQAAEYAAAAAAAALEEARSHRQSSREAVAIAEARAKSLATTSMDARSRIAVQQPLLARAQTDHETARTTLSVASRTCDTLPDPALAAAEGALAAAQEQDSRAAVLAAQAARNQAETSLEHARRTAAETQAAHIQAETRHASLSATLARATIDLQAAETARQNAETAVAACPDAIALAAHAAIARAAQDETRRAILSAESHGVALSAERRQLETSHRFAGENLAAWQTRLDDAAARATALTGRRHSAHAAYQTHASLPSDTAARAERSGQALKSAETAHQAAHAALTTAEQRVRALSQAQRDAEAAESSLRQRLVRTEASQEAAAGALQAVLARAVDRLGADTALPEFGPDQAAFSDAAEERARKKSERLTREREDMGPVNLRAELEVEELDARIAGIEREREDLATAIAKLRGAIGHLNREGRARLTAVFTQVDQHFRTLFTRMMGGGRAHLALTGSDDPLLAGLEIYAEPPGKKLAALSLLSGGEQALTALSLIFAVFRCTPAPISVLDEVDAPLDDANVERFCTLLDDIVRDTGTRFLVVTHHQLTMSRMDRLFGVTMQERGVSRLLSVDLLKAAAMVEERIAAE